MIKSGFSYMEILIYICCTMLFALFFMQITSSFYVYLQKQKMILSHIVEVFAGMEVMMHELVHSCSIEQVGPHEIVAHICKNGAFCFQKWRWHKNRLMRYIGSYSDQNKWHTKNAAVISASVNFLLFTHMQASNGHIIKCQATVHDNFIFTTCVSLRQGLRL